MKSRRQARIIELINEFPIDTQEELLQKLRSNGFNVTQATVSRDIKELRLLKTLSPDGKYHYTSITKSITIISCKSIPQKEIRLRLCSKKLQMKILSIVIRP